jgi:hypothetical protein
VEALSNVSKGVLKGLGKYIRSSWLACDITEGIYSQSLEKNVEKIFFSPVEWNKGKIGWFT